MRKVTKKEFESRVRDCVAKEVPCEDQIKPDVHYHDIDGEYKGWKSFNSWGKVEYWVN